MARIVVLAGGNSDEREVSLRSGAAVAQALKAKGHTVTVLDPTSDLATYAEALRASDVVFPALHGVGGEDGSLQSFLEEQAIPFVGSDSAASRLCFDKNIYTALLADNGFRVPQSELVAYDAFLQSDLTAKPFVLKPNDGGSSIDTFIVRDTSDLNVAVYRPAFERHETMLLQELITGIEITVAVAGNDALPVIEIIPPENQEFDYENKYNGATQEICPAANLSSEQQQQAQQLASKIHVLCGCRDLSRTDIIVTPSDDFYILETNTIPGLTSQSLLPKAAATAGSSMEDLCDQLVTIALRRS